MTASLSFADDWTENFDDQTSGTYATPSYTINGRVWTCSDAGNFGYGNTTMGSKAFTINDDKPEAHIATPALNTCGTVSFKYAYKSGNSSNVFQVQKSTDGAAWVLVEEHTLGAAAEQSWVDYSVDVNDASPVLYIRVQSDDQNAHLFIDDFTVTDNGGSPAASLTWNSSTFTEAVANDGSFSDLLPLDVDLSNETFAVSTVNMTENTHYSVANLPAGLSVQIVSVMGASANITLTGNATNHADADDISDLTITFLDAAFTGADAALVANNSKADIMVDFIDVADPLELTWSLGTFTEAVTNDGSVANTIDLGLVSESFTSIGTLVSGTDYSVTNLPTGLSVEIISSSLTEATLSLTGMANVHANSDDIANLTIEFLNAAFIGGDASAVLNATKSDLVIDYIDPYVIPNLVITEIMYNPPESGSDSLEFIEIYNNEGADVDLTGFSFSGVTHTFGNVVIAAGTYLVICVDSLAMLNNYGVNAYEWASGGLGNGGETVSLSTAEGQIVDLVAYDDNASWPDADESGHSLVLCDIASDNNLASNWNKSTQFVSTGLWASPMAEDLFCTTTPSMTWSTSTFTEAGADDGSVESTITLTITDDSFATIGNLTLATDYTVANVPTGLTVDIVTTSATEAVVSLSGNADSHLNTDDISDMEITFADAAFLSDNAEHVANSSKMDLMVNFMGVFSVNLTWNQTVFNEAAANDGTIGNAISASLSDSTFEFNGDFTEGTEFVAENVPAGLTVNVTITLDTLATISLTGTAASHINADDISNLTIRFTPLAIANGGSEIGFVAENTGLAVNFDDLVPDPELTWTGDTFNEAAANDGTIDNTISVTLVHETFTSVGAFTSGSEFTASNLPAGLTLVVTTSSTTEATISITGTAASHLDADDVNNLTLTFTDAAYTGASASSVINNENTALVINFDDPAPIPVLTWNETAFNENMANDGSISNMITATIVDETFATIGALVETTDFTVMNVPTGLSVSVETISDTEVQISLTGNAANHTSTDDITNLSIEFTNLAYTGADAAAVINNLIDNITISYIDPYIVPELVITEIMYNSPESGTDTLEFIEIYNNGTEDVQLENFYMAGVEYVFPNTLLAASNYIVISYNSDAMLNTFGTTTSQWTNGGLSNGGEPVAIYNPAGALVDSVAYDDDALWPNADGSGHSLVLCDYASDNNDAANWSISTNYVVDNAAGSAIYASPESNDLVCTTSPELTWDVTAFEEDIADDGSIATIVNVVLSDDQFAMVGTMVLGTHFYVQNVPAGLTVEITSSSVTEATIQLLGNATAHLPVDAIANLEITFTDVAFVSDFAANVTGSSKTDLEVNFYDYISVSELNKSQISIYPNPTKGNFKVEGEFITNISVTDVSGKVIINSSNQSVFDLSQVTRGLYFVKVSQSNTITTHKLVIE